MNARNLLFSLFFVTTLLTLSGCGNHLGKRLEFNGGELYYTSSITESEANRLVQYLGNDYFDGTPKTVQINKTASTYEFRMVIKKGLEKDPQYIEIAKGVAKELSTEVFGGSQVDIHLCDENLKTIRVVIAL
ncbi:MAG: hypothetical protein WCX65_05850 [bacterium]